MSAEIRLLCFGWGRCAQRLAALLQPAGAQVSATWRDPAQASAIRAAGASPVAAEGKALRPALAESTHLLLSVPPAGAAGDPLLALLPDIARHALALRWAGYLSTTGVYGDSGGAWVDEDSPPHPTEPRSIARLAAERAWQATGLPLHIFRLAGIYGTGRNPVQALREGTARRILAPPGHVFSRIHEADIAAALQRAIAQPQPGSIVNLADDEPASAADTVLYAARLLGLPPPPLQGLDDAATSPALRSFYAGCRRVANGRLRHGQGVGLGLTLAYPSYREGLKALAGDA